jgi:hypothetical protein
MTPRALRLRRLVSPALLALAAAALTAPPFAPPLRAQPAAAADLPKKEITEKTSSGFPKLQPLVEARNYDAALVLVDQLLAGAAPGSYDTFVLSQVKAQILLTQNKLAEALVPLETAHRLAVGNANFFESAAHLDQLYLLAQVHYQVGADQKTPALQREGYEKALAYLQRWLERSPRAGADVRTLVASLLYNLATLDPSKPDAARLREAIGHVHEATLLSVHPGNQLQLLLLACHLQLGENARAAELLEVLAARDPKSSTTWSQLQSLYLAAAAEAGDPAGADARAQNLRALLTLERAQAHGHLSSPKDHYTKVAILFNLQQFTRAAALLEKGLADGTLENSKRNWELLASAYQQTDQDAKALDAMDRAVGKFPEDGALEFSLAQFLYGAGRVADAYTRGQSALAKAGVEKPGPARLYLAFLAYELQRYEEAAQWVAAARATGDTPASTLDPLDRAITEALKARQALSQS